MIKRYYQQSVWILVLLCCSSLFAQNTVILTNPGTNTWIPPVGCSSFYVEMWGGGAGGNTSFGFGETLTNTGGGGGGSYAKSSTFFVNSNTASIGFVYTIGSGGSPGNNGGDTWFWNTLCIAVGGKTRGQTQQKSPLGTYIVASNVGGGGGTSIRNIFGTTWQGGGGGAARRLGDGYSGGNAPEGSQGGGAAGYAYDNVDISKGRGGEDGVYFPGIPGGGGAGNQTGAGGAIVITYFCNFSPGSIGYNHTVPSPSELGPFADILTNVADAGSFGHTYYWQARKENTSWQTVGSMGTLGAAFIQDSITRNTYYRRAMTGCGTTNNFTDSVLIKVFTATTGKNGVISGRVTSINGTTGVGGVLITAKKTVALRGSPQNYAYTATTDADGNYTIADIFYGDRDNGDPASVDFTVVATKSGHRLSSVLPVNLSFNVHNRTANFIDSTVFSVTGRVTQECSSCMPTYRGPYGVGNAKITPNNITIAIASTDSLKKDSIGFFGLAVSNPGTYRFTPSYLNHQFDSLNRILTVNGNVINFDFKDTTTREIRGKISDVAGRRIGSATFIFECVYERQDSLPITTFKKRTRINEGDSIYSVRLPAGKYRVVVDSFLAAYEEPDERYVSESSVKNFFNQLAIEPLIDVTLKDSVRNLVYHRPPVLQLFGLKDTACNTNPAKNPGLVFRTNLPKRFEAVVYEGPESIGDKVQIFNAGEYGDSLSNYLRFYTSVTKRSATEGADTLLFRLKNPAQPNQPMIDSFLIPGAPNFVSPFTKTFKVFYFDRYGRQAIMSPLTPIPDKTTVVGVFNPTNTFTTASPEIPFLVLHAPPGDQSYSFWSMDSSIQTASSYKVASQNGLDGFLNVSLGPKWSVDLAPISGPSIEVETVVRGNYTHQRQVNADTVNELITTTTINQQFQTDRSNVFIQGVSGDVYIGNGINYILGKSITVDFIPLRAMDACEVETASRLFMAPDSIRTEFAYAEDHIVNVIIPTQERLAAEATTDSARVAAESQVKVWQQVIEQNKQNKQNAALIRNRSFSNGVGNSYSETISKSSTNTISYEVMVANNFAAELGLYAAGIGASGGVAITMQQTTGNSTSSATTKDVTMGYYLQDDDVGDYYSVNVRKDPVYGTPVFELVAGTSSCPPEQDAQNRDQPQIVSGNMRFDSLTVNEPKIFKIFLANKSESGEARNYSLSVDAATSEGLVISASGSSNLVSIPVNYYNMPYGATQEVQIKVEKFNPNDGVLSYPNVEFYLADMCANGPAIPNTYSTAKLTFNYTSPCGSITLSGPADGFVANAGNGNLLPVKMSDYNISNIDTVILQYQKKRERSGNNWQTGFSIGRSAITDPNNFTYMWNISGLTDTAYNLRLKMRCSNQDIMYSDVISGVIDRVAPALIGSAQPVSGIYIPGTSNISFTYSEPIDNSNLNNGTVELLRRSSNSLLPVTVSAVNERLVITPVNGLGTQNDSFRVIVRNVADQYGNVKTVPDTSFFRLGSPAAPLYTGTNVATVHLVQSSIAEGSTDSIPVYFKLRQRATKVTRVYFNVSGTALHGSDYTVSYDTVKVKKCNNQSCTDFNLLPVPNEFTGYPGYVNIDSNQTQAVLYIHPKADNVVESNETIRISLVAGGDYGLVDSVQVTASILDAAAVCPTGNILYVNSNATGNNSGVSWQHAMTSLQAALNRACPDITQIWVAKGTYKPTADNSRDSSFVQRNNLAIYGGFTGNETSLSQRNWKTNPTILSGDIGVINDNSDNSYNIIRNEDNALNSSAVLDGFIITGGNAGAGTYTGNRGGGVHNRNSAPSFYNCIFTGNSAVEYGGAMFNENSAPLVVNSIFRGNQALYGGGLYNESASTRLINCTFSGNLAVAEGGAMSTWGTVTPQITNSIIWGNSSSIRDAGGSTPAVSYSIVQGGYPGTSNLDVDPLFIDEPAPALTTVGDLRLQGCSPALNAGNNAALPGSITRDLDAANRIVSGTVDMGAYERQSLAPSTIIYVDATATGANTGESWANAYTSMRSALTELNFCSPGTTILIAAGTYTAPSAVNFNFNKLNATVIGGYAIGGSGTPNPAVNRTILKGNIQVLKSLKMDGVEIQKP